MTVEVPGASAGLQNWCYGFDSHHCLHTMPLTVYRKGRRPITVHNVVRLHAEVPNIRISLCQNQSSIVIENGGILLHMK